MIVYATYIDNQKEIQYPIKVVNEAVGGFNAIYVSDYNEVFEIGLELNSLLYITDQKIKCPKDISIIQNKCIEHLLACDGVDFIVWCQADTFITKEGMQIIIDWLVPENLGSAMHLKCRHIRLFHECHSTYWGVTVLGKNSPKRFVGDGAYLDGETLIMGSDNATVDIGYMTIDQYRRHLKQHEKTWNTKYPFLDLPDKEFVQAVLERDKQVGIKELITPEHPLFYLVDKMGIENEYNYLCSLL